MRVVTGREMQAIDKEAIEKFGIPSLDLMERAGAEVARAAQRILSGGVGKNIVVVAGKGNNGGDGFVAARRLDETGFNVQLFLLSSPESLTGDAQAKYRMVEDVLESSPLNEENLPILVSALDQADLIIDAMFGTGFSGKVAGFPAEIIRLINESKASVLSVDIPSGVEADTGNVPGPAVRADETVTFGLPKLGEVIYPGAEFSGRLSIVDIGFPPAVLQRQGKLNFPQIEEMASLLPKRKPDTHKRECGQILVLAGSVGFTGAATLTCRAAMRAGAGIVTLGIPESLNDILEVKLTEEMTRPLPETPDRSLSVKAYDEIMRISTSFNVLALGPGLSRNVETATLVFQLLHSVSIPMVIDADGLNALEGQGNLLKERKAETIITPHPGELARLFGTTADEIQKDRIGWAEKGARQWDVILVLKGARSIVASPDGRIVVNSTGNPGMASAGTGDVLTGIIASLLGQGLTPFNAAVLGTYLQGLAGDMIAQDKTFFGLIASDLIDYLPRALKALEEISR